jgi:hypothetical protein
MGGKGEEESKMSLSGSSETVVINKTHDAV